MQPNNRWVLFSLITVLLSALTVLCMLIYSKYKSYTQSPKVASFVKTENEARVPVSAEQAEPQPTDTITQSDSEDEWKEIQLPDGGVLVRPETAFVRLSQQTEELLQKIFPTQASTYLTNHLLHHPEAELPSQDYFVKKLLASHALIEPQLPATEVLQQLDELMIANKYTLDKALKYNAARNKEHDQLRQEQRMQKAALPEDVSPDDYFATLPKEQQQWLKSMPLYKDNLTFYSKSGHEPTRIKLTPCPDVVQGVVLKNIFCQTAYYPSGAESIFYFQDNVLRARDDYYTNGNLITRYLFLPPPSLSAAQDNSFAANKAGQVYTAEFYASNGKLKSVYFYKADGTVNLSVEKLPEKHLEVKHSYDTDHRFSIFFSVDSLDGTLSSIHTTNEIRLYKNNTNKQLGTYIASETFMGESKESKGTWTSDDKNFVHLDNGRVFPPADYYPKAPTYCQLYPTGCKTEK